MKAVILERRGDYAAVLCENGTFENRRVSGEVGETVELAAEVVVFQTPKKNRWARTAVAAALALSVTGGTLGYMGGTASAYVSLDVEDSAIELAVNHFGRVIAVNAVSEDAEELAESLSAELRHKPVKDALDRTMTRLRDEGYLAEAEQTVVAGVASDNTRRKAELTQTVADAVDTQLFAVTESSRAEREQAHEQHISVGRFGAARDRLELPVTPETGGAKAETEQSIRETESAAPASGTDAEIEAADPQPWNEERATEGMPPQREIKAPVNTETPHNAEQSDHASGQPHQEGSQPAQPEEPSLPEWNQPEQAQEQAPQEQPETQQGSRPDEPPEQPQRDSAQSGETVGSAAPAPSQEQGSAENKKTPQEPSPAPTANSRQDIGQTGGGVRSEHGQGGGAPMHGHAEMSDRGNGFL